MEVQAKKTFRLSDECFLEFTKGDRAAFKEVYEVFFAYSRYAARNFGCNDEEADEVVQEAFISLYHHAGTLKSKFAVPGWLTVTIKNRVVDKMRTQSKMYSGFADEGEPSYKRADRVFAHELQIALVGELIDEFCASEGSVDLKLFYVDGWSVKAIAEHNQESTSAVTTRLTRMRRGFREVLEKRLEAWDQKYFFGK